MKRLKNTLLLFYIHDFLTYAQEITVDTLKLKNGNTFTIQVYNETYTYEVYDKAVVDPEDVSSLYIQPGKDIVTLITCTPYGVNTHRLLVRGERIPFEPTEIADDSTPASALVENVTSYYMVYVYVGLIITLILILLLRLILGGKKSKSMKEDI